MSKVSRTIAVLPLLITACQAACAADPLNCEKITAEIGDLRADPAPVWMTPQVPSDGVIEEFVISEFFLGDDLYVAQDLEEGVCILQRMLDDKTQDAVRLGLRDYVSAATEGSTGPRYELLISSINARLNDLYVPHGMRPNTGMLYIEIEMTEQFAVRRFGSVESLSPIQRQASALGIQSPALVLDWVWVEYLEQLDVPGFSSDEFISYLQTMDSDPA